MAGKFSQAAQDGQHQPPMRRCGIRPSVFQAAQSGFPLGNRGNDVEQIAGRTGEPV